MMGGIFKQPKAPTQTILQPEPTPAPKEEDPEIAMARRRKLAEVSKSGGRRSTILSGGQREVLGGG